MDCATTFVLKGQGTRALQCENNNTTYNRGMHDNKDSETTTEHRRQGTRRSKSVRILSIEAIAFDRSCANCRYHRSQIWLSDLIIRDFGSSESSESSESSRRLVLAPPTGVKAGIHRLLNDPGLVDSLKSSLDIDRTTQRSPS